jgi:hypothetical protein
VRVFRKVFYDLEIEGKAYRLGALGQTAEEPVIIAVSPAQPDIALVKSHARNDDQIYIM